MEKAIIIASSVFAAGLIAGVTAAAAAIGNSKVCSAAMEAHCKKPTARNIYFGPMVISVGLIESIPVIGTVIALTLIFANPFLK